MRRTIQIGLAASILLGLMLPAHGGGMPAPPNLSCTSSTLFDGYVITYTNIDVPQGETCNLPQFITAIGNVTVRSGAALIVNGNMIMGNLQADGARYVNLLIGFDKYAGPGNQYVRPTIGGDLSYKKLIGLEASIVCLGATIEGNLDISNSNAEITVGATGTSCSVTDNVNVQGNFKIAKTAGTTTVQKTTVGGNANVMENYGPVGLYNNVVGKTLDCKNNFQGVAGNGNQALSKKNQCAGL